MHEPKTPDSLAPHAESYVKGSWRKYTLQELGSWVHLLAARSRHRSQPEARSKDLRDANNYLDMMRAHLDALV